MESASADADRLERRTLPLEDPRQRTLYELLRRLVGEGPASFYVDACRHMSIDPPMNAVTHQVGHLLREIDTAMIGMLGFVTSGGQVEDTDNPLDDETRRRAVDAVLVAFEVPENARAEEAKRLARDLSRGREGRNTKIRSVLESLGIPADDPVRKAWISPSRGAHAWA